MISEWFTTKPQRYCSNQCKTVLDKIFGIQKKKSDACDSNKKRKICAHQLTASYFVGLDCCLNGLLKISPSSQCLSSVNSWVWPVWSVRVVFPISGVCVCLANLYMLVGHRSLQNPDGLAWNQIIIVIAFFFCLPHEDGRNSNLFPEPRSVARSRSLASADGICGLGNYLRRLVCYAFGMYSTKWFTALTR